MNISTLSARLALGLYPLASVNTMFARLTSAGYSAPSYTFMVACPPVRSKNGNRSSIA